MPETYVVHLGNSKELMEVAEDGVARRVLREHIREALGIRKDDLLFAIINSMLINSQILVYPIQPFLFLELLLVQLPSQGKFAAFKYVRHSTPWILIENFTYKFTINWITVCFFQMLTTIKKLF